MLKNKYVLGGVGGYVVPQERKKQSHQLREVMGKNKCSLDFHNSQVNQIIKEEY